MVVTIHARTGTYEHPTSRARASRPASRKAPLNCQIYDVTPALSCSPRACDVEEDDGRVRRPSAPSSTLWPAALAPTPYFGSSALNLSAPRRRAYSAGPLCAKCSHLQDGGDGVSAQRSLAAPRHTGSHAAWWSDWRDARKENATAQLDELCPPLNIIPVLHFGLRWHAQTDVRLEDRRALWRWHRQYSRDSEHKPHHHARGLIYVQC